MDLHPAVFWSGFSLHHHISVLHTSPVQTEAYLQGEHSLWHQEAKLPEDTNDFGGGPHLLGMSHPILHHADPLPEEDCQEIFPQCSGTGVYSHHGTD